MSKALRAALYARVSTRKRDTTRPPDSTGDDFIQKPENQLLPMQDRCKREGWLMVDEYIERETASGRVQRKVFKRLMEGAEANEYDVLVFWSLDRFSREGPLETLLALRRLTQAGVKFVSIQEPFIDTTHPFGEAVVAIVAALAQMETRRRSERAKAAIERKKRRGDRIGRDQVQVDEGRMWALYHDKKYSRSSVAKALGISRTTLYKKIREMETRGGPKT